MTVANSSALTKLLGIELPIIQAPMAGVQDSALAVAVANAGGLGSLPCAALNHEALEQQLSIIQSQTSAPINVNFFAHVPPEPDAAQLERWHNALRPYYKELGLDPDEIPSGAGRAPFTEETASIVAKFKPSVVSFHFGLPAQHLLDEVRSWGAKVLSSATTIDEALWLESQGVDAIIVQGLEAGGHRGHFLSDDLNQQMGLFSLLPQVAQRVSTPLIAAGGIADAAGVKAALDLGASAVQIGTAYLLCPEATTSDVHRRALQSEAAHITALTNLFSGRPARGMVNRLMRELGPLSDLAPAFPLATAALAPLRKESEHRGSGDVTPLWAGQNTSGCREIPAGELTRIFVDG